ncbi:MAG: tRNA (adenosine(37)-N6)-threonylcarbamoyltransferase complex transferase subunit TsaD [Candidatus Margulisiibacteriota bacterium]|nr:MAG: tRNA (adenosine(37)-N6)-threonylcarbamoyltransferase complex transferase subunit TsaD [Candidatus Margulisbacteria bacterium GWD2_39_127]OGI05568.1 MAG: tRNA (adenosine(37)-N6)-threonylcarbamoyltransferase complex transferase subunit TsaD [Candidatus Margulisbacteria bacterium GWF2_38_17]OGI09496.1 MAG: tRNA (adenosine(37)-N6)-threonylcarbamoyltransferase complex transferase subunit TsaD [Candidatus Margulisbacteria bacterium GWE2_39_32]PZM77021.1 MAG: tRNA (adenosine(37)-N6)-threonylcar
MLILGIETSCDETSVAIVEDGSKVYSNVIISQIKNHREYGGVVPEIASRKHTENISYVLDQAFKQANLTSNDIDAVAVSHKPGLFGALIIGVTAAKVISLVNDIPLVGVNHVIGHIYANFLSDEKPLFPFICLVVSGGHTFVAKVEDHLHFEILGRTRDDAAGEAFDKVARYLGLGYPGGPIIDKLAQQGNGQNYKFPRAMLSDSLDFSFSGLKTAVINKVNNLTDDPLSLDKQVVCDLVSGFQESVVSVLVDKTIAASKQNAIDNICIAGGVSANKKLRDEFAQACHIHNKSLYIPKFEYCTDNAAMIASAGYYKLEKGLVDGYDLNIEASFSL